MLSMSPISASSNIPQAFAPRMSHVARFGSATDSVRFSQAPTLTERKNQVIAQAFKLFLTEEGKPKTREQLLASVREHFGEKLEIFDGGAPGNDWVEKSMAGASGEKAFFLAPETLLYPNDSESAKPFEDAALPPEYISTINRLQEQRKSGLFLKKDVPLSLVMHEVTHALQFENGLPLHGKTREASNEALNFQNAFYKPFTGFKGLDSVLLLFKQLLFWPVVGPLLGIKSLLSSTRDDDKNDTPARAMRNHQRREMEIDGFLVKNGGKLGIPFRERAMHVGHFVFTSALQYMRSFWLG